MAPFPGSSSTLLPILLSFVFLVCGFSFVLPTHPLHNNQHPAAARSLEVMLNMNGKQFDFTEEESRRLVRIKMGKKSYLCHIPPYGESEEQPETEEEDPSDDDAHIDLSKVDNALNQDDEIKQVLQKALGRKCVNWPSGDWWAYGLCFGRHLTQFHKNPRQPQYDAEISLGQFSVYASGVRDGSIGDFTTVLDASSPMDSYVEFALEGGDECAAINGPRKTLVRVFCPTISVLQQFGDRVLIFSGVAETSSCQYLATVYHKDLCQFTQFSDMDEIPSMGRGPTQFASVKCHEELAVREPALPSAAEPDDPIEGGAAM